jgi:hypothetical protein
MAVTVATVLDDRIARYVNRTRDQRREPEMVVVRELVESGYDRLVRHFHACYQRGEITLRTMASELGLSLRELYDLLEQKGLST